jgi:hypothetical protein
MEYDEVPERDIPNGKNQVKIPPCGVCEEAKSRSRSRSSSAKNRSNDALNECPNDSISSSVSSSAASFNELLKHQQQKRNCIPNPTEVLNRSNDTYTVSQWAPKPYQVCNSPPVKSNLKHPMDRIDAEIAEEFTNYQLLLQKLIETEGVGNEIAKQLSALKDFLRLICNVNCLTILPIEAD